MSPTFTNLFIARSWLANSNNYHLYDKALQAGKAIDQLTHKGDVILIAKKTGEELYAAFLGAILVSRIPLVIQRPSPKVHQSFFEKRMNDLKAQVDVSRCICETEDMEKYIPYFKCINELVADPNEECSVHYSKPDDLAFLQMSSGTTGKSKICEITHQKIVSHCQTYGEVIGMDKTKTVVSWLPLYHDMGLIAAFCLPLLHGAKFVAMDPFDWLMDPKSLIKLASEHKATHCWMPSFAFNYLTNKVNFDDIKDCKLDTMEKFISCSEPTFVDDLARFGEKFTPLGLKSSSLSVCYALAENVFAVSQSEGLEETEWKGARYASCGKVIPKVTVQILKDGKDVSGTDDGTVMIHSEFEPKTNFHADPNGYYNTGDIGFFKDGKLHIIGREKDMFASYGVNVYPEMVEHVIANIPGVLPGRVVCFGHFDKALGTNRVVALAETENVIDHKLRMELSSLIKEEFGLTAIVSLVNPGSLVKTSSGKFSRTGNKEIYAKNVTGIGK